MLLSIISSLEQKNIAIDWLEVNTQQGNYVIQSGHVPTVLIASPGSMISYRPTGTAHTEQLNIKQAIVHVTRSEIALIVTQI